MNKKMLRGIISVILLGAIVLTGCSRSFDFNFNFSSSDRNTIKQANEENKTIKLEGTQKLSIVNETGGINVSKGNGDEISIKTKMEVRGQVEEEVKAVLNEIYTSAEYSNGTLIIKAVNKDGTKDFWKWRSMNHPMVNVNIHFYVELPKDFENYDIKLITGNIEMRGLTGSYQVNSTTGNITLNDAILIGDNQVRLITGNVGTEINDLSQTESLSIHNVTGEIVLVVPSDSNLDVDAHVTTGNIGGTLMGSTKSVIGGSSVSKKLGDGKTKVTIENVTGNINVNKK